MTKKAMIEFIEESKVVVNFSKSYFNHMLKEDVTRYYEYAVKYVESHR